MRQPGLSQAGSHYSASLEGQEEAVVLPEPIGREGTLCVGRAAAGATEEKQPLAGEAL